MTNRELMERKVARAKHAHEQAKKRQCVDRAFVSEAAEYTEEEIRDAGVRAAIAQKLLQRR